MNQLIFNAHACRLMNFNEAHHSITVSKKDKIFSVLSRFDNQYKYTQHNTHFYTVNKKVRLYVESLSKALWKTFQCITLIIDTALGE